MTRAQNREKAPGFAERLKKARIAAGLTQQQLADALEITLRNYQRYEAGETEPSLYNLITISITIGVPADRLLGLVP